MLQKSLGKQTLGVALLLFLSGCEVARNAGHDLNRLSNASFSSRSSTAPSPPRIDTKRTASSVRTARDGGAEGAEQATASSAVPPAASIIGKSESDLRAMFGPPTKEENRAPGKIWRYQDGRCSMDVQLYPDVQTRKFGTLAYEVKSDDNTDEGKRHCLGQLRSRAQGRGT